MSTGFFVDALNGIPRDLNDSCNFELSSGTRSPLSSKESVRATPQDPP